VLQNVNGRLVEVQYTQVNRFSTIFTGCLKGTN